MLRNLRYKEKDCVIYFDTIYGACEKTLASIVETTPYLHLRKVGLGQEFGYALPCVQADILNALSKTILRAVDDGLTPKVCIFDTIVSKPGVTVPVREDHAAMQETRNHECSRWRSQRWTDTSGSESIGRGLLREQLP